MEDKLVPQINLPLWGQKYYVLLSIYSIFVMLIFYEFQRLPGESRLFHEGKTQSYLNGSVTLVYYADKNKALRG